MRKVELLPTWECEAGYAPGYAEGVWFSNRVTHRTFPFEIFTPTMEDIFLSLPQGCLDFKWITIFVPIPAHAPITAHQGHFQFKICGTINRPLKSSHLVASDYVPSPVLNTENHQLTLCSFSFTHL